MSAHQSYKGVLLNPVCLPIRWVRLMSPLAVSSKSAIQSDLLHPHIASSFPDRHNPFQSFLNIQFSSLCCLLLPDKIIVKPAAS